MPLSMFGILANHSHKQELEHRSLATLAVDIGGNNEATALPRDSQSGLSFYESRKRRLRFTGFGRCHDAAIVFGTLEAAR